MSEDVVLQLSLLGSPHITVNGSSLSVDRQKATALLIYLAVTGERYQRQTLATLFWPEYNDKRAHANLRHVLWVLKKAIGPDWLEIDRVTVWLRPGFDLDIHLFQQKIRDAQKMMASVSPDEKNALALFDEAATLYRDTFLSGFTLRDALEFDTWQMYQAQYFRQQLETVLQFLIDGYRHQQQWQAAIESGQRWLALDPLHEPAHVQLMQLYMQAGKKNAAIRQYEACCRLLAEELNTAPQAETVHLYEQIQTGAFNATPVNIPLAPVSTNTSTPNTSVVDQLPLPLNPFFGRQDDLNAIGKRLENPFCRLLTIVGSGGIGKTRLAVQAARQQRTAFAHGVYFVPLAPVSSAAFLIPTIAGTLDVTFTLGKPLQEQLFAHLRQKEMLLVLDNFEHLLDGADLLLEILTCAPGVKLLVTSRERLNFQVEWLYVIQGLPFPTQSHNGEFYHGLERYSAVELFLHHAARVCPTFDFSAAEQTAVLRICQLLEGMPLGIELAAALRGTYSSAHIADQIQQNLDFLTTSMRDVPERHRSLRAVFEQSWNLLSDDEKQVLKQLSIFRGGFRLETAVQVIHADESMLERLINKSLLQQTANGRYEMHERLRQYTAEKLDQDQQTKSILEERYGYYFASFLQQKEGILGRLGQEKALETLREEIENIHIAWHWLVQQQKSDALHQALHSLFLFYDFSGWPQEGRDLLAASADAWRGTDIDSQLIQARLRTYQAAFENYLAHYEEAVRLSRNALAIFHQQESPREIAFTLIQLGNALARQGQFTEALPAFEESVAIGQELDDLSIQGAASNGLGNVYHALGRCDEAYDYMQETLIISRTVGIPQRTAMILSNLGSLAEQRGDYAIAKQFFEESLTLKQAYGEQRGLAISRLNLGFILSRLGEYNKARQLIEESLKESHEFGEPVIMTYCLMNLGNITYAQGHLTEAKAHYMDSLQIATNLDNRHGMAFLFNDLGSVTYDLKEYSESKQYFGQGLHLALELQLLSRVMEALVGMAKLLNQLEEFEQSIVVLSFILKHPATDQESKDTGEELLTSLASQTNRDMYLAAQERGKPMELAKILEILINVGLCSEDGYFVG